MAGGSGTQNQGQTPATGGTTQPPATSGYGGTTTPTLMNPSLYNPMTSPINTSGFGGAGQMPSFANNPFMGTSPFSSVNSTTQQDIMGGGGRGGYGGSFGDFLQRSFGGGFGNPGGQQFGQQPSNLMTPRQFFDGGFKDPRFNPSQPQQQNPFSQLPPKPQEESKVPDWVQAPDPGMATGQAFTELTNPTTGEKFMAPNTGYSVRGQQQTQQPQQQPTLEQQRQYGAPGQDYRTVTPQQIHERQQIQAQQAHMARMGMMGPQQQYYARMAEQQQRQNPYQRQQFNPYQRQFGGGIQGLMGMLGGRGGRGGMRPPPYMPTMGMPRDQYAMTMDMPQYQGRSFDLPTNFMKNGGKV